MKIDTETKPATTAATTTDPLVHELLARAVNIFGPVETIRLDADTRPLGAFFDDVRKALKDPYPKSVIAVTCGGQSALCAIMANMADADSLSALLKENAWLQDTVWTRWNNFVLIWLRIEGWYPTNRTLPSIGWIGSECMLPVVDVPNVGQHSGDFPISSKGATIMTVNFKRIVWPTDVQEMFILKRLENLHGPLFKHDEQHQVIFGDETAAHFLIEILDLKYSCWDDAFTMPADGKTQLLPKSKLHRIIDGFLRARAAAAGITYPSGHTHVKLVIAQLKRLCAVERLDAAEGIPLFLERLERSTGSDVTTAELFADYREFCLTHNAVPFPERRFLQRVNTAIREKFGLSKNHCIRRTDAYGGVALRYGWRNLAIKGA